MGRWKRNGVAVILLVLLCFFVVPKGGQAAEEAENTGEAGRTIRVAVPLMNDGGFVSYEEGEFEGYYIDYLDEIAKYTGWNYEYTPIKSYDELHEMCESGEFDLMAGIIYGEEFDQQYFDYPRHSVGAKRYVLAVPGDSELMPDQEYAYLRGVRVGVSGPEDELMERFKDFCFMYGIGYAENAEDYPMGVNFIPIERTAWRDKLASGEVDGLLASDAFCMSTGMYSLTAFGLDQIYFVAPNGSEKLLSELDAAIGKIINFNPEYNDNLYQKYFHGMLHYQASFNDEEREYLQEKHRWRVALPISMAPYAFRNAEGAAEGLIPRVLEAVSEHTEGAMGFEYVFYEDLDAANEAVRAGECDIAGVSVYSELVKNVNMRRSMSFYQDEFVYYKNDEWMGTEAEELGWGLWQRPGEHIRAMGRGEETYAALLSGTGDYYQSYYAYTLHQYPVANGDVMLCFAYGDGVDGRAVSVIDKSLQRLEQPELERYVVNLCMTASRKAGLGDYLWRYRYLLVLLFAGILVIICTLLVIIIVNVTRNSKKIYRLLYEDTTVDGISFKKFMEEGEEFRKRPGGKLILYINIIGFKYINDVFGYKRGNEVLRTVKSFLEGSGEDKLVARIYADRFVVLLSYESLDNAKKQIRRDLDEFGRIARETYPDFNLWIKVGAYVLKPEDDLQTAVNLANYAVDELETKSDNDVNFYDEEMHNRVLVYKEIETDMRTALANREFEAFYQPKFDITTKELVGAEALVRWRHRKKGLLSPGVFIPIFEKNHFILQVDFYIFRCVCEFQKKRMDEGRKLFPISSNFSRLHLAKPDFVDRLRTITQEYGVPSEYLEIEITETIAMEEFDSLTVTVEKLKLSGFKVSIDDFGSGYSSVQLLYKIPIDVLKLDKAFVDNTDASDMELELVDNIISVSQKNGIKIICEGVETREQETFVRAHKCNLVQGFLYSRPLPEEAFLELVEQADEEAWNRGIES